MSKTRHLRKRESRKVKHFEQRMSQRGIKEVVIDLALLFSFNDGDQAVLTEKALDMVIFEFKRQLNIAAKLKSRGGLVVVDTNNCLLTCYGVNG